MSKRYIIIGIFISSLIFLFLSIKDSNSGVFDVSQSRKHVCQTLTDDITRLYMRRHEIGKVGGDWLNRYGNNDIVTQLNAAINSFQTLVVFCPGTVIDILERADNQLHEHKK